MLFMSCEAGGGGGGGGSLGCHDEYVWLRPLELSLIISQMVNKACTFVLFLMIYKLSIHSASSSTFHFSTTYPADVSFMCRTPRHTEDANSGA